MTHEFFQAVTVAEFRRLLAGFAPLANTETVALQACLGRRLGQDVAAAEDLPQCQRATMDGFAVRAQDLFGASESNPAYLDKVGTVHIQTPADFPVLPGQCAAITTGGCLPAGADAVAMVEHTAELAGGTVEFHRPLAPDENTLLRGEDAMAGQILLPAGTLLRAQEIGLLAALGVSRPVVRRRPWVSILSTGDELVPVSACPRPGQVRDVNGPALEALVTEAGAAPVPLGMVADDLTALTEALAQGLTRSDVLLLSGGSSVGTRDLTVAAIQRLPGGRVLCHGVQMSPGKPTILAEVNGKPVVGLPGQVTAAQVVTLVLVQPLLRHLTGETLEAQELDVLRRPTRRAVLGRNVPSVLGREDYVRVTLQPPETPGELPSAWPRLGKSGLLRTLVEAHGLITIGAGDEGLKAGSVVDVWLI